jgi:hypothetical protein
MGKKVKGGYFLPLPPTYSKTSGLTYLSISNFGLIKSGSIGYFAEYQ